MGAILVLSALAGVALVVPALLTIDVAATANSSVLASMGPSCTVTINTETMTDNAVQVAIDSYGPSSSAISPVTICLGAGTFPEQLTINNTVDLSLVGSGNTSTFLSPTTVVANGLELDTDGPAYAVVGAWNDTGLTIADLAVEGATASTSVPGCAAYLGIYFGLSSGTITGTSVTGINTNGGCQGQNAIVVENGYFETDAATSETVSIVANTVTGFGKNGITCDDLGVSCDIASNTVTTTPMAYGFAATNGIQFWASSGTADSNYVSGNVYLPGSCLDQNYFNPGLSCVSPYWSSGLLLYDAGPVNASGNTLVDNQVSLWSIGTPTEAWDNAISGWGYYGIVLDFNYADGGGTGALVASPPDVGTAGQNQISDQNVGLLAYDDNATIVGNSFSAVNVSIEVPVDLAIPSTDVVSGNTGDVNVSGALLGDISSYQTGDTVASTAGFTVDDNSFTNVTSSTAATNGMGIAVNGASAEVSTNFVFGFPEGVSAVVSPTGPVVADSNEIIGPSAAIPGFGLYVFAQTATIDVNTVSGYSWMNGPGWWPNSQATGIFAQCATTCDVGSNAVESSAIGIAVLSYAYGPSPAPGWPYAAAPSAGPIAVTDNFVTDSGAFGIALELNQFSATWTQAPTVAITGNTVDNEASGAVGLMVDQGAYTITGNSFEGTTLIGSSSSGQSTGEGTIATASIQVLDAYDSSTLAFVGDNTYTDTALSVAVLNVTASGSFNVTVKGDPALGAPSQPAPSATAIDADESLSVSSTIGASSGVPPFAWQWLVAENGGSYLPASDCAVPSGSGSFGGTTETCTIAGGLLSVGAYYTFELEVTDSAYPAITVTSAASVAVSVSSTLTAPARPSVSATALDSDQALTVTGTVPSTGSPPVVWTWLVSVDGGAATPATVCSVDSGTGSGPVTCTVAAGKLTPGSTYAFSLEVTDSATPSEMATSVASPTVSVASPLTVSAGLTPSATSIDKNQAFSVSGTIPTSGTPMYTWEWMVSTNLGPYVLATVCSPDSGGPASGGGTVTCSVPASTLVAGDSYRFLLQVTDHATSPETADSASTTLAVSSALTAPKPPTVDFPALDANQILTVTGKIPTTGTPTYSWEWLQSVDSGAFVKATDCSAAIGSDAAAGATVTCTIAKNSLIAGDYYNFELEVTDAATHPQTKTSATNLETVTVSSGLTAAAAPSVSSRVLDVNQTLTVTDHLPTSGTAPYAWTWTVSINGGAYATSTVCSGGGNTGTGGSAGALVTCSVPAGTLTVADHYVFKLAVKDSATLKETETSATSALVTVHSALTAPKAPTVAYTHLALAQTETVTAKIPSTGSSTYSWTWLVSVNGGAFAATGVCSQNSGSGAIGGATITCTIAGLTLTIGDTYAFKLLVQDSATQPETMASAASKTVSVS